MAHETCEALRTSVAAALEVVGDAVVGHWCISSMRRALENLINNAVKYGDGTIVSVKIAHFMGRMTMSVHNNGVPIPFEQHERIFTYLRREDVNQQSGWGSACLLSSQLQKVTEDALPLTVRQALGQLS